MPGLHRIVAVLMSCLVKYRLEVNNYELEASKGNELKMGYVSLMQLLIKVRM